MQRCFRVHASDNVATLLEDAIPGPAAVIGGAGEVIQVAEAAPLGHKIALATMRKGDPVIKFGIAIGSAARPISPGEWVHLHNCRSRLDERSASFDVKTGAATDTNYA